MRGVPELSSVPEDALKNLAYVLQRRDHARGAIVALQGAPCDGLVLLHTGSIKA